MASSVINEETVKSEESEEEKESVRGKATAQTTTLQDIGLRRQGSSTATAWIVMRRVDLKEKEERKLTTVIRQAQLQSQ